MQPFGDKTCLISKFGRRKRMDKKQLVEKAKNGDQEAFVTLIKGYEKVLFNTALKMLKNETDVADTLQDTVLIAYEKLNTLRNPKYFNTWLYKILLNQVLKKLNSNKDFQLIEQTITTEDNQRDFEFEDLIQRLSVEYRTVIVLYYYNGFSIAEISKIMSKPIGTIKSDLSRARHQLRNLYQGGE